MGKIDYTKAPSFSAYSTAKEAYAADPQNAEKRMAFLKASDKVRREVGHRPLLEALKG